MIVSSAERGCRSRLIEELGVQGGAQRAHPSDSLPFPFMSERIGSSTSSISLDSGTSSSSDYSCSSGFDPDADGPSAQSTPHSSPSRSPSNLKSTEGEKERVPEKTTGSRTVVNIAELRAREKAAHILRSSTSSDGHDSRHEGAETPRPKSSVGTDGWNREEESSRQRRPSLLIKRRPSQRGGASDRRPAHGDGSMNIWARTEIEARPQSMRSQYGQHTKGGSGSLSRSSSTLSVSTRRPPSVHWKSTLTHPILSEAEGWHLAWLFQIPRAPVSLLPASASQNWGTYPHWWRFQIDSTEMGRIRLLKSGEMRTVLGLVYGIWSTIKAVSSSGLPITRVSSHTDFDLSSVSYPTPLLYLERVNATLFRLDNTYYVFYENGERLFRVDGIFDSLKYESRWTDCSQTFLTPREEEEWDFGSRVWSVA